MKYTTIDLLDLARYTANAIVLKGMMFYFFEKMYLKKNDKKYVYVYFYLITVVTTIIISLIGKPWLNIGFGLLSMNIVCFFLHRTSLWKAILYNTCYFLATVFSDIVTVILIGKLAEKNLSAALSNNSVMYISSVFCWIIVTFLCQLLIHFFNKNTDIVIRLKEIVFLVYITGIEIVVIMYAVSTIHEQSVGSFLCFLVFCFWFLNLYIIRLLEQSARNAQLKYELALAEQQTNYQWKYYQDMKDKQEIARQITHDVRKHLNTLGGIYGSNNQVEAQKYSLLLDKELDKLRYGFSCSNKILSVIIGAKLHEADKIHVDMTVDMEDVWLDFIDDLDLTVIFSNLLDNSFEAVSQMDGGEKRIFLQLRKLHNFLILHLENPIINIPIKKDGIYQTTKPYHDGVGLKNVQNAVQKYDGIFTIEVLNQRFIVKITIPIP